MGQSDGDSEIEEIPETQASSDENVTRAVLTKIEELVPLENREKLAVIVEETISSISHHSGPLPRPSDLAAYETIRPGFAERIMRMAEGEQTHRHENMNDMVKKGYRLKSRGQIFAIGSVVILTAFASYVAYLGDAIAAVAVVTVGIVSVVSAFVARRLAPIDEDE